MSGSGWKKPIYKVAEMDSKGFQKLGRVLGWEGLEEEGKRNADNPGRAIGKATQYALTYYLGGLLGGGAEGAGAGADVAESGGTLALNAAGTGVQQYATEATKLAMEESLKQAAQQGAQETAKQGLVESGKNALTSGWNSLKEVPTNAMNSLKSGINNIGASPASLNTNSMESALMDTGYTPSSLKYAFQNANADNGAGLMQNLAKFGRGSAFNGTGQEAAKNYMKTQQIMGLLNPQQGQQPQQMAPSPRYQQAEAQPLESPYGPGGNSMGLLGMTEEQKKKLRAMGYRV